MAIEHFDVLIVGAGLSGIGAGYHLQANSPNKTYTILEGREAIGGILPTEGEAILIANPLFVDCRVLPCQAPKHNAAAVVDPDRCATGIVLSDRG